MEQRYKQRLKDYEFTIERLKAQLSNTEEQHAGQVGLLEARASQVQKGELSRNELALKASKLSE